MTFEKWWSDHKYHIGLTSMVDCKAAYLAGQESAEQRVKELEIQRDEWKHLVKEVDKQLRTEIGALQAKCAELTRERDEAVRQWERFERMAGDNWAALKAQAGEPVAWQHRQRGLKEYEWQEWQTVGYKPQGPESQTFQMRPLFTHPTPERPYNPLNDYAVIPMNPTEPVKAQAGEPVAWMNKRGDVISAEEKTLIIENGKLGYPGGEFDLHAKNIERSYTIPLGVINV